MASPLDKNPTFDTFTNHDIGSGWRECCTYVTVSFVHKFSQNFLWRGIAVIILEGMQIAKLSSETSNIGLRHLFIIYRCISLSNTE